jgi:hypothetical protein
MEGYDYERYDYAKCIEISKRVRWDIDKDVIRGREFDLSQKFLPDGLSKVGQVEYGVYCPLIATRPDLAGVAPQVEGSGLNHYIRSAPPCC